MSHLRFHALFNIKISVPFEMFIATVIISCTVLLPPLLLLLQYCVQRHLVISDYNTVCHGLKCLFFMHYEIPYFCYLYMSWGEMFMTYVPYLLHISYTYRKHSNSNPQLF